MSEQAGEALDARVAELMGWHKAPALFDPMGYECWFNANDERQHWIHCYHPSTKIEQAMEVLDSFGDVMRRLLYNKGSGVWECIIDYKHVGVATTIPLAICLCALKVAEVTK